MVIRVYVFMLSLICELYLDYFVTLMGKLLRRKKYYYIHFWYCDNFIWWVTDIVNYIDIHFYDLAADKLL